MVLIHTWYILGDVRAFQPPHPIDFRKRTVVIVGAVGQEFPFCLFTQALGVHQEKDSVDLGIFQQTIYRRNGCKGLACAGGHLNQRSGTILGKGLLQTFDSCDLATAEAHGVEVREVLHVVADGILRL